MTRQRTEVANDALATGRMRSFGQDKSQSFVDRFGIWLSKRAVSRAVGPVDDKRVADLGCGYHAEFAMQFASVARELVLADVTLSDEVAAHALTSAYLGYLPDSLAEREAGSLDVIVANNILEHLWSPGETLVRCFELLAEQGVLFVNVPSWRGKWFLELAAFRLGLSPAEEMNDHKMYYDPRDLWPLLVRAGFLPQHIRIGTHKFGLNTFAIARKGRQS